MPDFLAIIPTWLPGWIGAGAAAGGSFGMIKWLAEFVSGRIDKRSQALDEDTRFLFEGLKGQVKLLTDRTVSNETELRQCKEDLALCNERHLESERELAEVRRELADSRAEVAKLTAIIQGIGDARQHAALIVAAESAERKCAS